MAILRYLIFLFASSLNCLLRHMPGFDKAPCICMCVHVHSYLILLHLLMHQCVLLQQGSQDMQLVQKQYTGSKRTRTSSPEDVCR